MTTSGGCCCGSGLPCPIHVTQIAVNPAGGPVVDTDTFGVPSVAAAAGEDFFGVTYPAGAHIVTYPGGLVVCHPDNPVVDILCDTPCPGVTQYVFKDGSAVDQSARLRGGLTFSADWSGLGQADLSNGDYAVGTAFEFGCVAFVTTCAAEQVIFFAQSHLSSVLPLTDEFATTGDFGWSTQASVDGGPWINVSVNHSVSEEMSNGDEEVSTGQNNRWVVGKGAHEVCFRVLVNRNDFVGPSEFLPNQAWGQYTTTELCCTPVAAP